MFASKCEALQKAETLTFRVLLLFLFDAPVFIYFEFTVIILTKGLYFVPLLHMECLGTGNCNANGGGHAKLEDKSLYRQVLINRL